MKFFMIYYGKFCDSIICGLIFEFKGDSEFMSNFEMLDNAVLNEIDNGNIIGANLCVIKDGNEIYKKSFGYADKANNRKMQEDTIFRMFSMSKLVTSTAVMMLFERGEIDLFDPVSKYLEGFKNQKVTNFEGAPEDVAREVTIRDLLNMTSGVMYPDDSTVAGRAMMKLYAEMDKRMIKGESVSTHEFTNRMGQVPLAFEPGERWMYGSSADVLGGIIEVASGKKFGQFLKDEIFDKLGMTDTGFFVSEKDRERFAEVYKYSPEQGKLVPFTDTNLCMGRYRSQDGYESGGAGLVSTIDDYKKFALMLLNKGEYNGVRILGKKTVEFMAQNQLNDKQLHSLDWDSMRGYGYGNLLRVMMSTAQHASNGSEGEFGWDGWTGNYVTISPKDNLVFLYFVQLCDGGSNVFTRKLRSIVYGSLN